MDLVLDELVTIPLLLFAKTLYVWLRDACTVHSLLQQKNRHVILHCICLVKPIEHMLILVQLKWSSAYQIQCPHSFGIHQSTDSSKDESIFKKSCLPEPLCTVSGSHFKISISPSSRKTVRTTEIQ